MKLFVYKRIILLLGICIFCLAGTTVQAKVVVITGVTEDQAVAGSGLNGCITAIKEGLQAAGIPSEFLYYNLSEDAGEAVVVAEAEKAIAKIKEMKPEAAIVLNDFGIKHVASKIDDVPIVVAYFFNRPQAIGLPKPNVTGIARGSYAADMWKNGQPAHRWKNRGVDQQKEFLNGRHSKNHVRPGTCTGKSHRRAV